MLKSFLGNNRRRILVTVIDCDKAVKLLAVLAFLRFHFKTEFGTITQLHVGPQWLCCILGHSFVTIAPCMHLFYSKLIGALTPKKSRISHNISRAHLTFTNFCRTIRTYIMLCVGRWTWAFVFMFSVVSYNINMIHSGHRDILRFCKFWERVNRLPPSWPYSHLYRP